MLADPDREVLRFIVHEGTTKAGYPTASSVERRRPGTQTIMERLQEAGFIRLNIDGRTLVPTAAGLRSAADMTAWAEMETMGLVLGALKDQYSSQPQLPASTKMIAEHLQLPEKTVGRVVLLLAMELGLSWSGAPDGTSATVGLDERILDADPFSKPGPEIAELWAVDRPSVVGIRRLAVDGWAPFKEFSVDLDRLTVLVGANATGKSSLGAVLAWLAERMRGPMPPEIAENRGIRSLFRKGAAARLSLGLNLDIGQARPLDARFEVLGPEGNPRVVGEFLGVGAEFVVQRSGTSVRFRGTSGGVQQGGAGARDFALANLGPAAPGIAVAVRDSFARIRVYGSFDVKDGSLMRFPQLIEPDASLNTDGSNLVAVLHRLRNSRDTWDELQGVLRSAVPGFRSLEVEAAARKGHAAAFWREEGVSERLELADLSDGTLRLLCWVALCLSAKPGTFIVADEPEQGLHPRVLAVLADLFGRAADRGQVLVMTHSPDLLARFPFGSIRVLTKEDGVPKALKPADSAALRGMLTEVGGGIAELFRSEELEALS